ncbi:MAG TPA: hypothetical protein VKH44_12015, partial [Pirellulaceae bacterium]|nr:hypothetical protein [Pirellulaceae bacterium]
MDERLATLLADLERAESLSAADLHRAARRANWVAEYSNAELAELLAAVGDLAMPLTPAADRLLANWLVAAVQARRKASQSGNIAAGDAALVSSAIEPLYRDLGTMSR